MVGRRLDVAENSPPCGDVLPVSDARADVPVLERPPAARAHADLLRRDERHRTVEDGIDGRAVGSGDVDALVEREAPAPAQKRVQSRRAVELHARIAKVRADEVFAAERLDGVAVALAR